MKRTTEADIAEMRSRGFAPATVANPGRNLSLTNQAAGLSREIERAFEGVALDEGIGLREAQGIDDREDEKTCASYRERDEKNDWRKVPKGTLNRCHSSPSFLDSKGFRFYLPAFMCAELRDEHGYGFEFTLVQIDEYGRQKFSLLTPPQRAAVRAYLSFLLNDPEYGFQRRQIERALEEYWTEDSCSTQNQEAESGRP